MPQSSDAGAAERRTLPRIMVNYEGMLAGRTIASRGLVAIADLSEGGVRFHSYAPFQPGASVMLRLLPADSAGRRPLIAGTVLRCTAADGDFDYAVACEFEPL